MLKRFSMTIRLPICQKNLRVVFHLKKYLTNDNLCIEAYKPTLRGYVCYDTLTVNTRTSLPHDCACIDVNHHGYELVERLEKLKLGKRTGQMIDSGYCSYPVFQFRNDLLLKHAINADFNRKE